MTKPKIVVFASGSKDGGGSGFENLVHHTYDGDLDAEIVAVVSNHENGGVRKRAEVLGIPFILFNPDQPEHADVLQNTRLSASGEPQTYQSIVKDTGAEWVALSGWLKLVDGLDPRKTFNIHPALLSQLEGRFGGPGMYGHNVHEAVAKALGNNEIKESGISMHFVTDEYDRGPVFFEFRVPLKKSMSVNEIAKAVNQAEHEWQPRITNMVVHGEIAWDGKKASSLKVPKEYEHLAA